MLRFPYLEYNTKLHKRFWNLFKDKIRKWRPINCPCRLCKKYIPNVAFINQIWFSILLHNIWPSPFEVNWVSIPSNVYMWASWLAVFQEIRRVSKSQGSSILFFLNLFKNLFQLTPTLTLAFTVTIISNSSVFINLYDGRIRF